MHPRQLSIADFTYDLPADRIAYFPLEERDDSRLLIYQQGQIETDTYRRIANHLPADALLVFNNSKVIGARIHFRKESGGNIEVFCLEPSANYADTSQAMLQTGEVEWRCLVGGASKWKPGQVLEKRIDTDNRNIVLSAVNLGKQDGLFLLQLKWTPSSLSFAELLQAAGTIPLPPYIKRIAEDSDKERYQTIYARQDGSVAAPTAGLHFTRAILQSLEKKGIEQAQLTLHVGAGTFQPVKSERMEDHEMHAEWMEFNRSTIEQLRNRLNNPIVAVGTTSLRSMESLYWLGVRLIMDPTLQSAKELPVIDQWLPYDCGRQDISAYESLTAIIDWMSVTGQERLINKTRIIIAPGYRLRIAKALITNFHQPQSTLLLLIAALVGDEWKKIYAYALENEFRFLSYGDGCLLWPST